MMKQIHPHAVHIDLSGVSLVGILKCPTGDYHQPPVGVMKSSNQIRIPTSLPAGTASINLILALNTQTAEKVTIELVRLS